MSTGKIAVSLVSVMLVIGVVVGVVTVLKTKGHYSKESKGTQATMRTITSICEYTEYKEACASSLESTAKNSSATTQDYILAVVGATLNEVKKALEATDKVAVDKHKDESDYTGVQDCKDFLDDAVGRLDSVIQLVNEVNSTKMQEEAHKLLSWVTGVYSAQTTCLEQLTKPEYKQAIESAIENSTQLAHNAVNIVAEMSQMITLFNLGSSATNNKTTSGSRSHTPPAGGHRRLLVTDNEGLPTWLSAADRKLLSGHHKGGGEAAPAPTGKPHAVVAKDGSGQYKTVGQAIASYPAKHQGRYIIYIKSGVYNEQIIIDKKKPNIFMYGDGIGKTVITGDKNFAKGKIQTMHTSTFANEADGFLARGITFRNDAGPEGHQAVAFRNKGDMVAIFDCAFEAYQDTLYYQLFRIFFRNCRIYGTIDFIFGKGQAMIQDSEIIVRKPLANQINTVTADGKEIKKGSNGLVIQNCKIVPDQALFATRFDTQTFLGRPWTPLAFTMVMQSELGDFIRPEGWKIWDGANYHKTCEMLEYANRGPGAATAKRTKEFAHFRIVDAKASAKYTAGEFLAGKEWLPQTGFPNKLDL